MGLGQVISNQAEPGTWRDAETPPRPSSTGCGRELGQKGHRIGPGSCQTRGRQPDGGGRTFRPLGLGDPYIVLMALVGHAFRS
jgi:hypothetical protein